MDREYPNSRAELEDKERWPYNDLQSLASDLDYGNPVGEARDDLVSHAVAELDLPATAPDREVGRETDREVDRQVGREGPPGEEQIETDSPQGTDDDRPVDPNPIDDDGSEGDGEPKATADGGTQSAGSTDGIDIGHQGSEKLSPAGAPESQGTAVEPPGDLESDDIDRDVLECDAPTSDDVQDDGADEPDPPSSDDVGDDDSSVGLRDRLGLGSSEESPDDVVNEADDPAERQRREEFKQKLEGAVGGADQDDVDDAVQEASDDGAATAPTPSGTSTAQGMVVDEEIVGSLIEMPFNTAAAATGWDGWELSPREREANARLFVAMCDEHDVNVGPTVMFALSMSGTAMDRAMRYKRHKSEQDRDDDLGDVDDAVQEASDDSAGTDASSAVDATVTTAESEPTESQTATEENYGF
jgi:hypothetical protein